MIRKKISAEEVDRIFDEGKEDILDYFDLENPEFPNKPQKRVNVDFPGWMVSSMDKESKRLGVTRQSLIKMWIADKLASLDTAKR